MTLRDEIQQAVAVILAVRPLDGLTTLPAPAYVVGSGGAQVGSCGLPGPLVLQRGPLNTPPHLPLAPTVPEISKIGPDFDE